MTTGKQSTALQALGKNRRPSSSTGWRNCLTKSYRLTAENAALGVSVIRSNVLARGSSGKTAKGVTAALPTPGIKTTKTGKMPVLYESKSWNAQVNRVCRRVRKLISEGVDAGDIAVLARYNQDLKPFRRDLLGFAGMLADVADNHVAALRDVLCVVAILERLELKGLPATADAVAKRLPKLSVAGGERQDLAKFAKAVSKIPTKTLEGRFRVVSRVYLQLLGGINANKPLRNFLNEVGVVGTHFGSARRMLKALDAPEELGALNGCARRDAVTVSTVHKAKGREWKHVFVVGLTNKHWPSRDVTSRLERAEEARTLFVAVTRAIERVYLHWSPMQVRGMEGEATKVSRLLSGAIEDGTLVVKGAA